MIRLKRKEAFDKMVALFGPWNTWGRDEHLAYGLIRGVPYEVMERCANDNPLANMVEYKLWQLGAWPEHPCRINQAPYAFVCIPQVLRDEVYALVKWNKKKKPRVKKITSAQDEQTHVNVEVSP